MSNAGDSDKDDLMLFHEAMKDVTRLDNDRVEHTPSRNRHRHQDAASVQPEKRQQRFSTEQIEDCDIILRYESPGLQKSTFKKLRSGKLPPQATLDLHGLTIEQARLALLAFLDESTRLGLRTVCIVHGKGFGSSGKKPVLKPMVNSWLQSAHEVLGFCSALPRDGGTGSVYVLLRNTTKL